MRLRVGGRLAVAFGAVALLVAAELALRARYRGRVLPRPPATESNKITIVALGDSITAGRPGAPDDAWPAILAARLRASYPEVIWQVVNAGIPGDTAPLGHARFDRDVAAQGPQAVLIAFGLNDCNLARHALDRWYERRVPVGPARSYLWRAGQARCERLARWVGRALNLSQGRVLSALGARLTVPAPELEPQPFPRTTLPGFSAALAALIARTQEIGARPVLLTMTPLISSISRYPATESRGNHRAACLRRLILQSPQGDFAEVAAVSTAGRGEPQAFRAGYAPYNVRIRELADQRGLPLVELVSGAPDDAFELDGCHLTTAGQKWAADRIYEALAAAGVWAALAEGER